MSGKRVSRHAHPRAFANNPNRNSCDSSAPISHRKPPRRSETRQSQSSTCRARRRDCRSRRSPYLCVCHSTAKPIAPVRARDLRYDRLAISPELPKPGKSSTRSHQDKQGRKRTFLILPLRISLHARGIMFSKSSCIMSPNHLRRSHASPGLKVGRMGGERSVLCRYSVRAGVFGNECRI